MYLRCEGRVGGRGESGMTEIKSGSMLASARVVSVGRVHESDERGSGGEWTRVRGGVRSARVVRIRREENGDWELRERADGL